MKATFVDTITPETGKLVDYFQVLQCDVKTKKDGAPYLTLKLGDRTGSLEAKAWDTPAVTPKAGDVVKIEGDASSYRNALQITVRRMRVAEASEFDKGDYIPTSKQDRDVLLVEVLDLTNLIGRVDLRSAVQALVIANSAALRDCPAAKKNHQPYLGGLMEHVLGIARSAIKICEVYPQLDRDILLAAAIIHDIGKLAELTYDTHIGYSRLGSLVGHVTLGALFFDKVAGGLDAATRDHVFHIIASHHGQLLWRAATVPQTKEAMVFHCLDMLDARLHTCEQAIAAGVDENGFTAYIPAMESALWNGK